MDAKKVKVLINTIENTLELLKLELEETPSTEEKDNTIDLREFLRQSYPEEDEINYAEEPDNGPGIILNSKKNKKFIQNLD